MTTDHQPSVTDGEHIGQQLMPMLKWMEERTENKVHFWAGLFSSLAGQAGASIGPEAVQVIGDAIQGIVAQLCKEKGH